MAFSKSKRVAEVIVVSSALAVLILTASAHAEGSTGEAVFLGEITEAAKAMAMENNCMFPLNSIHVRDFSAYRDGDPMAGDNVKDPKFANFVVDFKEMLQAQLQNLAVCQQISSVTVVRLPLVVSSPAAHAYLDGIALSETQSGLSSPWVVMRAGKTSIDITAIFNERQFVVDAATKALGTPLSPSDSLPIPWDQFEQFSKVWEPTFVIKSNKSELKKQRASIAQQLPADVYWLFENSVQSTRGGAFSKSAKRKAVSIQQEDYDQYLSVTLAAVREGLQHPGEHLVIAGILDPSIIKASIR